MDQKLHIVTIVLDGMPWIRHHLAEFEKLEADWHWYIVEGVSKPVNCTSWCKEIEPRLSTDGTTEYLDSISIHPRVTVFQREEWEGKLAMLNEAVGSMNGAGVILQVDADELWRTAQLEKIVKLFRLRPSVGKMYFFCRYFLGPDIVTVGDNCFGNNRDYEWLRAWRFTPGNVFQKHERPVFNGNAGLSMGRHETAAQGLVFEHMAYALESQVAFKSGFYGYEGAVEQWRRLQANQDWPVARLHDFLPWVDHKVGARKIALAPDHPIRTLASL